MSSFDQICTDFRKYAGEEVFSKFVHTLNRLPIHYEKMRHRQQKLWDSFASEIPSIPTDFAMIRECLTICEIHGLRLQLDSVDAPYSQIQYTRTQSPGGNCPEFPYPGWSVSVEDWGDANTRKMDILYCPQCRELRSAFESSRESPLTSSGSDMVHLRKLENEYRAYASSGVDAEMFYRTVRDDGCTKLQGFILLRDLMNCNLEDAIRIDSNYRGGST